MKKNEKLLTARIGIALIGIALITFALVLYHEHGDSLYQQVENALAHSMNSMDNKVAGQ